MHRRLHPCSCPIYTLSQRSDNHLQNLDSSLNRTVLHMFRIQCIPVWGSGAVICGCAQLLPNYLGKELLTISSCRPWLTTCRRQSTAVRTTKCSSFRVSDIPSHLWNLAFTLEMVPGLPPNNGTTLFWVTHAWNWSITQALSRSGKLTDYWSSHQNTTGQYSSVTLLQCEMDLSTSVDTCMAPMAWRHHGASFYKTGFHQSHHGGEHRTHGHDFSYYLAYVKSSWWDIQ